MQETMKWIENYAGLRWTGATILNMEAVQQPKGRRGGLAIIISPYIEFTELHRTAIGIDLEALKEPPLAPEHVQVANLFNTEDLLPSGEVDITQRIVAGSQNAKETTEDAITSQQAVQTKNGPKAVNFAKLNLTTGPGPTKQMQTRAETHPHPRATLTKRKR